MSVASSEPLGAGAAPPLAAGAARAETPGAAQLEEDGPLTAGARVRRALPRLVVRSLRLRLYSVLGLVCVLVIGLGTVGFARLAEINRLSEVIRDHWLRDMTILGDLSNYMSDYRAAEADRLLASTPAEREASERDLGKLHAIVAASQRAYEAIPQAKSETELYGAFAQAWAQYLVEAGRVTALADGGSLGDAIALYHTESRAIFDRSSDILAHLTDGTVRNARADSERAAAAYARARSMIVAAMLLAAALLVGVVIYVTRGILWPLLKLVDSMRALAHHDTDLVIPSVDRNDEIGEMARAVEVFRDNALALVASQRRSLEQAAALEQGLENERRLTAQQRDFVTMTSHEFRTPLTVIDGHAQRLIKMSERLDPKDVAERGQRIRGAVQRITHIMDSLLGASRVLDGNVVFHPAELDPRALIAEACQAHRDATRGAVIVEHVADLPARIHGDSKLLFHAIGNLISNAVKFSPVGSPVEVAAREEEGWLLVHVCDHGIGIPARDRKRLFERYFRGSNATAIAGTGVGLHLVEMVVKLHRGEVYAESLEGVGSRFVVRLPLVATEIDESATD